jgi:hypothetical protein
VYPTTAIAPTGGFTPYTIAITGLPSGLIFNGTAITGKPTVSGTFPLSISVADTQGNKFNITTSSITVVAAPVVTPTPVVKPTPPNPATSCTIPTGGKALTSNPQANVTGVTASTFNIAGKTYNFLPCTKISWQGNWSGLTKAIRNSYNVQVNSGYTLNGVVYTTSLIVDNGL